MGHPKCTEGLVKQAVKLKKNGISNKHMAMALGIAERTLYKWLNEPKTEMQVQLGQSLHKAEAEYFAALRSRVLDASERDWHAAAWMLERQLPDEYGRRERHEVVAEVDNRHTIRDASASPEALEKAEELLELLYGDGR